MVTTLFGIVGIVGMFVTAFSFIFGFFGMIFPNATSFLARKYIFSRYFTIILISSIVSVLALHAGNLFVGGGSGGWGYQSTDNLFQLSIGTFFTLMSYGALAGVFIAFVGTLVGAIWPPFIFRKTRREVFKYWGTIILSFLALSALCLGGNGAATWYRTTFNFPSYGGYGGSGNCGNMPCPVPLKPVIYLYPTHKEPVSVTLNYAGTITDVYPLFNDGTTWNVNAYPDGHLIDLKDGRTYSYLFWEGKDAHQYDLSTGFVVKGSDTASFLRQQLAEMGLTPKEYNEFIVYWLPKLEHDPYNLIHFAGSDYANIAKLNIVPAPDSILRIFMVYRPLSTSILIVPQSFPQFARKGFTVVEWGGTEL